MKGLKIHRFQSEFLAHSYADRSFGRMVLLGDDGMFWVVTMAVADKLLRAGYEMSRA